jgi:hypothetical protein
MFKELSIRVSGEAAQVVRRLIETEAASGPNEAVAMALAHSRDRGLKAPPAATGLLLKAKGLSMRLSAENTRAAHALAKGSAASDSEQVVDWALREFGRTGSPPNPARQESARRATAESNGLYSRRDFIRCLIIALVVGTALVLINVRPAPGEGPDGGRIALNYAVPFIVSTSSAILANHARVKAAKQQAAR